jgi:hypothetical protein
MQKMARRRSSSASSGTWNRSYFANREFEASIHQLTEESIQQSLAEIEEVLKKQFGERPIRRTKAEAEEAKAE